MIGTVFIASLRHNDNGLVNISGLNEYLYNLFRDRNLELPNGLMPATYGDAIFTNHETIISRNRNPTEAERLLDFCMSAQRIHVEHCFADHNNLFGMFFRHSWRLQLFSGSEHVRQLITVSFLIQNCYYCVHESRSAFFPEAGRAPTLTQYLPLDEEITPHLLPILAMILTFSSLGLDWNCYFGAVVCCT
jgi:hypothetical protein